MAGAQYARQVNPADVNNAHTLVGLMVPGGAQVLDVGAGVGAVARFLVERGCQVWGVEIDREAARQAARWCVRVSVGDVEELDIEREFPDQSFTTILCLDVLEHLRDPVGTLRRLMQRLEPGGQILISLPNITHASVRLQLLHGQFPRTDVGLLDRTHLHFFDRAAALRLLSDAGLSVVEDLRVVKGPEETEIPLELGRLTDELVQAATDGPDAYTYQFVFAAVPEAHRARVHAPALSTVLQQRLTEALTLRTTTERWARSLEAQHAQIQSEATELRYERERVTAERDAAVKELEDAREDASRSLAARADLQQRFTELLDRIEIAAQRSSELVALQKRLDLAESARTATEAELAYERRVAEENVRRHEVAARHAEDLTAAHLVRGQRVAELEAQLVDARETHLRLQREVTFLQNDRVVKDAFIADLRERLHDAASGRADARTLGDQLERKVAATERLLEEVSADRALARSAADEAAEALRQVQQRLSQPRYVLVDRLNSGLKAWPMLHRTLKRFIPIKQRSSAE
jgi:2-polyprenyl-3-methyl-5-hydroxy-6-metoxy-1,4-benzoquinol methylase